MAMNVQLLGIANHRSTTYISIFKSAKHSFHFAAVLTTTPPPIATTDNEDLFTKGMALKVILWGHSSKLIKHIATCIIVVIG